MIRSETEPMINVVSDRQVIAKSPELGLVCITVSKLVRFRALTRKRLLQFSPIEQEQLLRDLYRDNLNRLVIAINFCASEGIRLYRLSSALFPFADDAVGAAVLRGLRINKVPITLEQW